MDLPDQTDPTNTSKTANNISSLATGMNKNLVTGDTDTTVTSGIADTKYNFSNYQMQSPLSVYPLRSYTPYNPNVSRDSSGGANGDYFHDQANTNRKVYSAFKLAYRRFAVPQSLADSTTDMESEKAGNNGKAVWVPNLHSYTDANGKAQKEEAYQGHFLQATGVVNVHIMVDTAYGNAMNNIYDGNYGVMVRFKMEKGVNAAAIAKAIVWDRAYFRMAIDVPKMSTDRVTRIYVPMQFDHTVYLDPNHPNIFYLKVKGIPFANDNPATTSLVGMSASLNMTRGVLPFGTTRGANPAVVANTRTNANGKVQDNADAVPRIATGFSATDMQAYLTKVPAAKNIPGLTKDSSGNVENTTANLALVKNFIQQDLRDFQNNVSTYTGSMAGHNYADAGYPTVSGDPNGNPYASAQSSWAKVQKNADGSWVRTNPLMDPSYQINSVLDPNAVDTPWLWNPGAPDSGADSSPSKGYSVGYPYTYSLLSALFTMANGSNYGGLWGDAAQTLYQAEVGYIAKDGFAGSCYVNFFIDMDKYNGNLDDHSPAKTLTKGMLMPSAQKNHTYNLSMDIVGSDKLVDPQTKTTATPAVSPHDTPMDRALIRPDYYTEDPSHLNAAGKVLQQYLWAAPAIPPTSQYVSQIRQNVLQTTDQNNNWTVKSESGAIPWNQTPPAESTRGGKGGFWMMKTWQTSLYWNDTLGGQIVGAAKTDNNGFIQTTTVNGKTVPVDGTIGVNTDPDRTDAFAVSMNSWNSYVSPWDWSKALNTDNTQIQATSDVTNPADPNYGSTIPWESVTPLGSPNGTAGDSSALLTKDGSKSYNARSVTLEMAASGLLSSNLPQSSDMTYGAYDSNAITKNTVSTARFARVVNYYSNFENIGGADTDAYNWGTREDRNTQSLIYTKDVSGIPVDNQPQVVNRVNADVTDSNGNAVVVPTTTSPIPKNLQVHYSAIMGDGAYTRPATLYVIQNGFTPRIDLTNRVYNVTAAELKKGITIDGNWTADWTPALADNGKVLAHAGDSSDFAADDHEALKAGTTGAWTKTTKPDNSAEAPGPHSFSFTVNDVSANTDPSKSSDGSIGIVNTSGPHVITVRTKIVYAYQGRQYTGYADAQQIINVVPDDYDKIRVTKSIVTDPAQYGMTVWGMYMNSIGTGPFVPTDYYNYASPYDTIRGYVQPTDQIRMRTRIVIPADAPSAIIKRIAVSIQMPKTNDSAHPYFTLSPGEQQPDQPLNQPSTTAFTIATSKPGAAIATQPVGTQAVYNTNNPAILSVSSILANADIMHLYDLVPGAVMEILYTVNVPDISAVNIPSEQVLRDTVTGTSSTGAQVTLSSNAVYLNSGGDNTYGLLHVPDLNFGEVDSTAVGTAKELPSDAERDQYFEAFDNRAVEPIDPDSPTRNPWHLDAQLGNFSATDGSAHRSIAGSKITFNYATVPTPSSPTSGTMTAGGDPVKILTRPGGKYPANFRQNVGQTTFTVGDNGDGTSGFTPGGKYQATITYTMTADNGSTLK